MTGFQPDIEHVYRILQKYSDQNQYIYGNDANSLGSKKVVERLSHTLRHVAQFQTNRPYGIQSLLIGIGGTTVYTVNPSGGWRHWTSRMTAIGRNGKEKRNQLYQLLIEEKQQLAQKPPKQTIMTAMHTILQADEESAEYDSSNTFQMILFLPHGNIKIVRSKIVQDCYKQALQQAQQQEQHNNNDEAILEKTSSEATIKKKEQKQTKM